MQNANRAKQLKEVELDRAEVKDDGKWEVSQQIRDSWGVSKAEQVEYVLLRRITHCSKLKITLDLLMFTNLRICHFSFRIKVKQQPTSTVPEYLSKNRQVDAFLIKEERKYLWR